MRDVGLRSICSLRHFVTIQKSAVFFSVKLLRILDLVKLEGMKFQISLVSLVLLITYIQISVTYSTVECIWPSQYICLCSVCRLLCTVEGEHDHREAVPMSIASLCKAFLLWSHIPKDIFTKFSKPDTIEN